MMMKIINIEIFIVYERRIIGAIFCHVIRIKLLFQFIPSIISGNQKWNGAAPIFNRRVELIKIENKIFIFKDSVVKLFLIIMIIIKNKKVVDAIA